MSTLQTTELQTWLDRLKGGDQAARAELINHSCDRLRRHARSMLRESFPRVGRWEQTDDVVCVHPGWTILRGWINVADSWDRILNGPGHNQFLLTNTSVRVEGDTAWVVLDENLMTDGHAGTIACTNVFRRDGDDWRMVVHHGSPVMSG